MRSGPAVVDPVSPCDFCRANLAISDLVCPSCGAPQKNKKGQSLFKLMGFEEKFQISQADLTRRYYELSRILHPDRFRRDARSGVAFLAEELMSEVNEAFETLKNDSNRRQYLIAQKLSKEQLSRKMNLPMELAERWFEVQEKIEEATEEGELAADQDLMTFKDELNQATHEVASRIHALEKKYDESRDEADMSRLYNEVLLSNVLNSLQRDVERIGH